MIISTLAAMTAGFVLSIFFGTPKAISAGRLINMLCSSLAPVIRSKYQDSEEGQHTAGTVFITLICLIVTLPVILVLTLLYIFFPVGAIIVDAVICWSVMDIRTASSTAAGVVRAVRANNPEKAAKYASVLCEADCTELDKNGSVRAAVQGISDRTVDQAAAPLLCMALLSGVGGAFYAASVYSAQMLENTCDEADPFAAPAKRLRDILLFLPGKLAAYMMLVDALFLNLNTRQAEKTLAADSGKCRRAAFGGVRAVTAGVTGISLLPEEVYSEQFMRTYTIGEHLKDPDEQDIVTANHLRIGTAVIIMLLCFMIKLTVGVMVK